MRSRIGLAVILSVALTSCATIENSTKLQAPFDSFVCYNKSFGACLDQAQAGQLKAFHETTYRFQIRKTNAPGDPDPAAGKIIQSKDGKYKCDNGTVPYNPTLVSDVVAPAVFVSPVILRQIGEMQIKVARARTACERLIQAYEYQIDILVVQDQLARSQKAVALLTAELESDRSNKDGFGSRALTPDETSRFGVQASSVRDALRSSRSTSVDQGETLRAMFKTQTTDVEYKKQFADANLAIDLQLRELGRTLFILDRALAPDWAAGLKQTGYRDGSWVRQGTIVLAKRRLGGDD